MLPYEWADDDAWKDGVMRPRSPGAKHDDSRVERDAHAAVSDGEDRALADAELARGGCATCVWLDDPARERRLTI